MIRINTTSSHSSAREWASMEELEADVWPRSVNRADYNSVADYVAVLLDVPLPNVVDVAERANIERAVEATGIPAHHIALWLATIEEGHSPEDWDTIAEAYYLGCFVGSQPQIIEEHQALPFDEDETEDWEITNISYGRRLIRRTSGR